MKINKIDKKTKLYTYKREDGSFFCYDEYLNQYSWIRYFQDINGEEYKKPYSLDHLDYTYNPVMMEEILKFKNEVLFKIKEV